MNSPIGITKSSEAARQAVIESLTRSDRKAETASETKRLDESSIRRPAFRPVRMMLYI